MMREPARRLVEDLARLRPLPEFQRCHAHALEGARRLLAAVEKLTPAAAPRAGRRSLREELGEPAIGELIEWNEALRAIAEGRRVCGVPQTH